MKLIKRPFSLLVLAFALSGHLALAGDHDEKSAKAAHESPEALAVLFYADWCGTCKALDPRIEEARKDLASEPVLFTRFDLTNDATRYQAGLLAQALDIQDVFDAYGGKTGFLLLIDPKTGKVIDRVGGGDSVEDIKRKIQAAS